MGGILCRTEEPESEEKNKRMGYIKKPTEPLQVIESGKGIANICSQQLGHPQQNYFQFEEFSFDSKFESGNLALVQRVGLYNYNIWVNPEQKSPIHHGTNAWFYFEVRPLSVGPSEVQEAKFTIKNLPSDLDEAFERRAAPVYLNTAKSQEWQYIEDKNLETVVYENLIELKIKHIFTGKDDKVAFAFSFPYTLKDTNNFLDSLESFLAENSKVHFVRQVIAESIEKRPIECVTFTGCKGNEESRLKSNQSLKSFSEEIDNEDSHTEEECYMNKKCVLITCRTCPGETAASFALEGLMRRILSQDDEISRAVLENFVFLIIPAVNPDGVVRGNMSNDSRGRNLSRVFDRASKENYPGPQKIRDIAKKLKDDGILMMTLDLRANYLFDSVTLNSTFHNNSEKDIPISMFSLLLDMYSKKEVTIKRASDLKEPSLKESTVSYSTTGAENSAEQKLKPNRSPLDFNYGLKAFAMSNAGLPLKDKDARVQKIRKEGCRLYMDQSIGVNLAFCIDINFFWGVERDNPYINNDSFMPITQDDLIENVKSPSNRMTRAQTQPISTKTKRTDETGLFLGKNFESPKKLVKMYPNDYREIGETLVLSLLELEGVNPKSILPKTYFKTSAEFYEHCKKHAAEKEGPLKDGGKEVIV